MAPDGHLYTSDPLFEKVYPDPIKTRHAKVRHVEQQRLDRILKAAGSEGLSRDEAAKLAKLPRKKRKAALKRIRRPQSR